MNRPPFSQGSQRRFPSAQSKPKSSKSASAATDFLRMNDRMAALFPAVARLATLQEECSAVLPALFDACTVLRFEADQLTIGAPNAALAAKLKQQLPKLQDRLQQRGWQVNAIRIKVQVSNIAPEKTKQKELVMPQKALTAFETLKDTLGKEPGNQQLMEALEHMLKRHGKG